MHAQVPGLCRFILFGLRSHSHPAEARSAYCTASMSALAARLAVALRPTLYTSASQPFFAFTHKKLTYFIFTHHTKVPYPDFMFYQKYLWFFLLLILSETQVKVCLFVHFKIF